MAGPALPVRLMVLLVAGAAWCAPRIGHGRGMALPALQALVAGVVEGQLPLHLPRPHRGAHGHRYGKCSQAGTAMTVGAGQAPFRRMVTGHAVPGGAHRKRGVATRRAMTFPAGDLPVRAVSGNVLVAHRALDTPVLAMRKGLRSRRQSKCGGRGRPGGIHTGARGILRSGHGRHGIRPCGRGDGGMPAGQQKKRRRQEDGAGRPMRAAGGSRPHRNTDSCRSALSRARRESHRPAGPKWEHAHPVGGGSTSGRVYATRHRYRPPPTIFFELTLDTGVRLNRPPPRTSFRLTLDTGWRL